MRGNQWLVGGVWLACVASACSQSPLKGKGNGEGAGGVTEQGTGGMIPRGTGAVTSAQSSSATVSASSAGGGGAGGGGAGGMPACAPIFAKVVSNQTNPNMPGAGLPSVWSYKGLIGMQAGKALCQDVGADHVCNYTEVVKADAQGELANLPPNLSYWLVRTTAVPDPTQPNKACNVDADCKSNFCDKVTKICSWPPGAGAQCQGWSYPTNHMADGEWFEVFQPASMFNSGGVHLGGMSYHYDADPNSVCNKDPKVLGCPGPCGGASRAILCCHPC